ncbi:MAG: zf-HC2 domain-containing protein [Planctomycetes bacterium]|nr:zf-HC2 domain-containing protein [Planctomycetota bacterium]
MQCETARFILELDLARMGEADWRDLDAVEAHLQDCPDCQGWHLQRQAAENRMARIMRNVPAIRGKKRDFPSDSQSHGSKWSKRYIHFSLVAAVILLAFSPMVFRQSAKPLDIDLAAWIMREGFESSVDGPTADSRRLELERRFARIGVNTRLPDALDYSQLLFSGLVELQGHAVPQLVFSGSTGDLLTQVLVFDSRKFDLSSLPESIPTGLASSEGTLLNADESGRFVALVVDGFRRKGPAGAKAAW